MSTDSLTPQLATILRRGYKLTDLRRDTFSGITVGIVALPLAMAIAIASGVTPERGLITAVVAGFLISALGGSRVQIGGPTGAFIVVLAGVVAQFGYAGLATATFLAGGLLLIFGLARFGKIIQFIPYPVTTGFTTGIALIIFSSQVPEFIGIKQAPHAPDFLHTWQYILQFLPTLDWNTFILASSSLLFLMVSRRILPHLPGALPVVILASAVVYLFDLPVATIGSRFGAISMSLQPPALPDLTLDMIRAVFPAAFTIAILAGVESLLSAVVADGMTGERHRPNCELVAQGVANIASACMGGISATGAIARTATNIKSGAASPISGMIHALVILLFVLTLAPLALYIPLATLAAVLFLVAWNMSEVERFRHLLSAPRSDVLVLLVTFGLTVFVDLVLAVEVGVVLAALLFMKRMSEVSETVTRLKSSDGSSESSGQHLPPNVEVFEIKGPFFFGVADRLISAIKEIEGTPRAFIFRLANVSVMDATGIHALMDAAAKLQRAGSTVYLCEVSERVLAKLIAAKIENLVPKERICKTLKEAVTEASLKEA